jgi:putative nucleotidyltransferase with HDIG domain
MSHTSIRVSTLRGDQKINFNVFVKINEKYILYLKEGDSFEGTRLKRLKEKKVKKMYILEDHENLYRSYLQHNIESAYDTKSNKSLDVRAEIIQGSQQANAEDVMDNPGDEFSYEQAKVGVEKFFTFLEKEQSAAQHILKLDNIDQNIAHHGVTVATLAKGLAKKLGVTDGEQLQLMGLGALLHDLEHFHNNLKINQTLASMSTEDLKLYKNHPFLGAEKTQDKKHFDLLVTKIILQHEETIDTKGFPKGLNESQIDPMALIVGCANYADRLLTFESVPRQSLHKQLMLSGVGRYPLGHLQALNQVLQAQLLSS